MPAGKVAIRPVAGYSWRYGRAATDRNTTARQQNGFLDPGYINGVDGGREFRFNCVQVAGRSDGYPCFPTGGK